VVKDPHEGKSTNFIYNWSDQLCTSCSEYVLLSTSFSGCTLNVGKGTNEAPLPQVSQMELHYDRWTGNGITCYQEHRIRDNWCDSCLDMQYEIEEAEAAAWGRWS
jgi:hypothetical protein